MDKYCGVRKEKRRGQGEGEMGKRAKEALSFSWSAKVALVLTMPAH